MVIMTLSEGTARPSLMAMKTVSVVEAKAHFSECVKSAEGGDVVVIARHGKPIAALVSAKDLKLIARGHARGAKGTLLELTALENMGDLANELTRVIASRGRPRHVPDLE